MLKTKTEVRIIEIVSEYKEAKNSRPPVRMCVLLEAVSTISP